MAKRGNLGGAAAAGWIIAAFAALAPGLAQPHGGAPPRSPAGWVEHKPRLSDFPRLHERARSGHRPAPGRSGPERRRMLIVPAAVPVYSYYGNPWPDDAPPPQSLPPAPVAWAGPPPPPPAVEPPPRAVTAVIPAPETPIYYCSEIDGYTNDLKLLQCPGRWQRVSP